MGLWKTLDRTVQIKGTLGRDVAWQTLLHELVHAALADAGVQLSEKKEEMVADAVSSGMMHVVRHLHQK